MSRRKNKEAEESAKGWQMHIAKLQEKKNKFNHGLGGLQEDLQYGPPLMDHNYVGNGRFSWQYQSMENYSDQCTLGEE